MIIRCKQKCVTIKSGFLSLLKGNGKKDIGKHSQLPSDLHDEVSQTFRLSVGFIISNGFVLYC